MAKKENSMSLADIEANEQKILRETLVDLPNKNIFSRIFVNRPRFALVIAVVMTLVGLVSIGTLPITQYPEVTPPTVRVSATYPGANAVDLANTVAIPLESQINGVEDMLYMESTCTDNGSYSLTITFAVGSNRDMNMVRVQNRISQVESKLPAEVKQQGITVESKSSSILGFLAFSSPSGAMSNLQISDYLYSNVRDAMLRINGVGGADVFGAQMAMRIWLDPERLSAQGLSSTNVTKAIASQNQQAALGSVGTSPVMDPSVRELYTITTRGRLSSVEEFENIVVRTAEEGGLVRLRDVARVEIGGNTYNNVTFYDGKDAVCMMLQQTPGTNAIDSVDEIRTKLDKMQELFPEDLKYTFSYDATEYVRVSIEEIVMTLFLTFALVVIVCYVFLQDFRATLVPLCTIPVSLLCTFAVLQFLGFSINTLTLFALVLAIGLVVDDAIVVVERVLYHMQKNHLDRKTATLVTMHEVTGAVIATTLVLLAIFVPVGFIPGITGRIYSQFAVTISTAVLFSSVNALTLSPALCATILGLPKQHQHGPFAWFNTGLDWLKKNYVIVAKFLSARRILTFLLLVAVCCCVLLILQKTPTSFIPEEDQGVVFADICLREGTNRQVTDALAKRFEIEVHKIAGVDRVLSIIGHGMVSGDAENVVMVVVTLRPWAERKDPKLHVNHIIREIQAIGEQFHEAKINSFAPPAIMGLGMTGGMDIRFQSLKSTNPEIIERNLKAFVMQLNAAPEIARAFSTYTSTTPHINLDIDRTKVESYKVPVSEVYATMQNYLGSRYVNDINIGTQVNKVIVQSDWKGRATPDSIERLYVPNTLGEMIPLSALVTKHNEGGTRQYMRYSLFPSATITAMAAVPSGEAMAAVDRVAKETLTKDFTFEWSGLTYQEQAADGQTSILIIAAFIFGYLFLVAQYESWTMPLSVMTSVSVACVGALMGIKAAGLSLSIYAQLGLILLIGLAAKNAILIVEFAAQRHTQGLGIVDASGEGAGERLRAVLMTALTFILGVLPMVYAAGAGATSRQHIGITVYWGMIAATTVGLLMIPALYSLFENMRESTYSLCARNKTKVSKEEIQ
ncbi:MAG: efflux RND transporter permease subunit [Kiritimatiellia bacterium]